RAKPCPGRPCGDYKPAGRLGVKPTDWSGRGLLSAGGGRLAGRPVQPRIDQPDHLLQALGLRGREIVRLARIRVDVIQGMPAVGAPLDLVPAVAQRDERAVVA